MTKSEIIEAIALSDVPPGSKLAEYKVGDLNVSQFSGANAMGAMKLLMARQIVDELTAETVEFPDTPNTDLLQRLYEAFLNYNTNLLISSTMESVDDEIKMSHCHMVLRLRDISKRLNIPFTEPDDNILT